MKIHYTGQRERLPRSLKEWIRMKRILKSWTLRIALVLFLASALFYTIHYLIFRDSHHIFIYMIGDFGFLFIDVLLVMLIIERLLSRRAKRDIMQKLNMVIGTFFSEVGMELLHEFGDFVKNAEELEREILINSRWTKKDFQRAREKARSFHYTMEIYPDKLVSLRDFLKERHSFLIRLLENPNLLENQKFTDLLWAVFHLSEELNFRESLDDLPASDINHLKGDLKRAYSQIISEWIQYTAHLKDRYPFLFSLAARMNPLNPQASPIVSD
jgi:hypothetical protein